MWMTIFHALCVALFGLCTIEDATDDGDDDDDGHDG